MRHRYLPILLLLAALGTGCTPDYQDDLFDKSPALRLKEEMARTREILLGAPNGWVMSYYPDSEQSYGGFNYTVKFGERQAEIGFEWADVLGYPKDTVLTSYWKLSDDTGNVLSFDTYNDFMHMFSTPSASQFQAMGGDFEFEVMGVKEDEIRLLGRRSHSKMVLQRLDREPALYLSEASALSEALSAPSLEGTVGGTTVTGTNDLGYRRLLLKDAEGNEWECPYRFTPDGISLYEAVEIGGVTVKELSVNPETQAYSAEGASLQGGYPENYQMSYAEYLGAWTFNFWNNTADLDVTIEPLWRNMSFLLKGVSDHYRIILNFDSTTGAISWNSQTVAAYEGKYYVILAAWDTTLGNLFWGTGTGFNGVLRPSTRERRPIIDWEDTGVQGGDYHATSFIAWMITPDGKNAGRLPAGSDWYINKYNTCDIPFLNTLIKK